MRRGNREVAGFDCSVRKRSAGTRPRQVIAGDVVATLQDLVDKKVLRR
jgi:hypothetical protein